jgi:hypothetical protein
MADGRNRSRKAPSPWHSLCDERGSEDGIDPRRFFGRGHPPDDRRSKRLCGAAGRALSLCLPSILGGRSRGLAVECVEPAPQPNVLRVVLRADRPLAGEEREQLLGALALARGALRAELAGSIRRRRAPDFVFLLLGAGDARA